MSGFEVSFLIEGHNDAAARQLDSNLTRAKSPAAENLARVPRFARRH